MADEALYYGTGRRKNAVARVRLVPGTGKVTINGRDGRSTSAARQLFNYAMNPLQGDRHHRSLRREGLASDGGGVSGRWRPASRHLPRSTGGRRLPRRAEEGWLPHARRPYGGAQEVRSEEGPQAPAVLQALSLESRIVYRCCRNTATGKPAVRSGLFCAQILSRWVERLPEGAPRGW